MRLWKVRGDNQIEVVMKRSEFMLIKKLVENSPVETNLEDLTKDELLRDLEMMKTSIESIWKEDERG